MQPEKFSVRQRVKSFRYAFAGFRQFFATQHNAIIHGIATIAVIILSVALRISWMKWLFIVNAIVLVWMAELFNTAIEKLCDRVNPERHPDIKFIKDVAAAAVLVTALGAVVTAAIIFIPEFL